MDDNSDKNKAGTKIPRAIHIAEDGKRTVVGLTRDDSLADTLYDPNRHNPKIAGGRLVCETCNDVDVHYTAGSIARGGDHSPGAKAHFASNPGQADKHSQECRDVSALQRSEETTYDEDKGFRLHLNTGAISTVFNASRVYHANEKGHLRLTPRYNRLSAFEPVSVKSASDFLKLFKPSKKGVKRLQDSFLIARDFLPVPWNKFFVKYKPPFTGMRSLIDSNESEVFARRQPALYLAHVEKLEKKTRPRGGGRYIKITCQPMKLGENDMGVEETVYPQIFIDEPSVRDAVIHAIEEDGLKSFLVLGRPNVKRRPDGDNAEKLIVDFTVNDPREICLESVTELVKKRAERLGDDAYNAPGHMTGRAPEPKPKP